MMARRPTQPGAREAYGSERAYGRTGVRAGRVSPGFFFLASTRGDLALYTEGTNQPVRPYAEGGFLVEKGVRTGWTMTRTPTRTPTRTRVRVRVQAVVQPVRAEGRGQ